MRYSTCTLCIVAIIAISAATNYLYAQQWVSNGPYGGNIRALVIDPADTNIIYAGTYGAGMWRSHNGGRDWVEINTNFPVWADSTLGSVTLPSFRDGDYPPVTAVRVSPYNSARIYAGTFSAGIVQSSDSGNTWISTNEGLPESASIRVLWIHPQDSTFLLCGTEYPGYGGLYKSTNAGHHWTLVDSVPHGESITITTIAHNPQYPDSIYISYFGSGLAGRLAISPDKGNTWELVDEGSIVSDLQIDPTNTRRFWSIQATGFGGWSLYYSNNGGYTWNSYPDTNYTWKIGLHADADWNLYSFDYREETLLKSIDRGNTWTEYPLSTLGPRWFLPGSGPLLAVNPQHTETVYWGDAAGVMRSDQGGANFRLQAKGMLNTYINQVVVNPKNPQIIYAGGEQGLWKSVDGGESWIRIGVKKVTALAIDPRHPDTLYWGGEYDGEDLMRTYDGGMSKEVLWSDVSIYAIAVHPDSTHIIYLGVYPSELYKSSDRGESWNVAFSDGGVSRVFDIVFDNINADIMYFCSVGGLYKSINGGSSWWHCYFIDGVRSIAIHPTNPEIVYISANNSIKVSLDGCQSFQAIGPFTPSIVMSKIAINPANPLQLFAGSLNKGAYYSLDAGQNWRSLPGELGSRIKDIDLITSQKQIFLGTYGAGVWRGDDIVLSIQNDDNSSLQPQTITLLPAYPNPFNSRVVIPFELPKRAALTLTIYNIRGQIIKRFTKKTYPAGRHQVHWDGNDERSQPAASGIYLLRLTARAEQHIFSDTRKIILLK